MNVYTVWTAFLLLAFIAVSVSQIRSGMKDYKKHPERYSEPPWSKRR